MPVCDSYCPRTAVIEFLLGGLRVSVPLVGDYQTDVAGAAGAGGGDFDISSFSATDRLTMRWNHVRFIGHHRFLGRIEVTLNKEAGHSEGSVVPLSSEQDGFFPARNVNAFYFDVAIPRFRLSFSNEAPLENAATIHQIPPVGVSYFLTGPVAFKSRG